MIIPNTWENKKCSKPPTSHDLETELSDVKLPPSTEMWRMVASSQGNFHSKSQEFSRSNNQVFVTISTRLHQNPPVTHHYLGWLCPGMFSNLWENRHLKVSKPGPSCSIHADSSWCVGESMKIDENWKKIWWVIGGMGGYHGLPHPQTHKDGEMTKSK